MNAFFSRSVKMRNSNTACIGALALLLCGVANAAEVVVAQKGKAFSTKKLSVKLGDSVKFVNEDPFSHNVFSLSDAKSFDLGSYGQGGAKTIVFDKAGTVEVECAVHPDMKLIIEVSK
jgi:plastocyanin